MVYKIVLPRLSTLTDEVPPVRRGVPELFDPGFFSFVRRYDAKWPYGSHSTQTPEPKPKPDCPSDWQRRNPKADRRKIGPSGTLRRLRRNTLAFQGPISQRYMPPPMNIRAPEPPSPCHRSCDPESCDPNSASSLSSPRKVSFCLPSP